MKLKDIIIFFIVFLLVGSISLDVFLPSHVSHSTNNFSEVLVNAESFSQDVDLHELHCFDLFHQHPGCVCHNISHFGHFAFPLVFINHQFSLSSTLATGAPKEAFPPQDPFLRLLRRPPKSLAFSA